MDYYTKENIENQSNASVKRTKGGGMYENIKKLKTVMKPLCDVKNIIEDKINAPLPLKTDAKEIQIPLTSEDDNHCEDLFFYSELEENFEDIIPKYLQLEDDDISKFVSMFDPLPMKKVEKMKYLPIYVPDVIPSFDDIHEVPDLIKGLNATDMLFDDLDLE